MRTNWWESEADIIWQAEMLGLEEMIVRDAEGGLVNKEELVDAIWIHAVVKHGCVVCRMKNRGYVPAEVHHLLRGGKRMGHRYTIGLCPTHHRGEPKVAGEFSRHKHHKRFNAEYGTDHEMWGRLIEKAR